MPPSSDAGKTIEFSARHIAPTSATHYLTIMQGVTIRRALPIGAEPLIVGRDPSRAFHLSDADVSRSHCAVRLVGDTVLVRDLGSTNGTFIDGVRLTDERPLPLSSLLQLGGNTLKHQRLRPEEAAEHEQFASELERARAYVQSLIPPPLDHGPIRIQWCFVPSSILGGDALGYHALDGTRWAIYLLDVCGHGVASAMHSASVLSAVRNQTLPNTDFAEPGQVLERLNDAFQMDNHGDMYFSMFYAVVDPEARRLRYSSAGHPPAVLIARDGEIRARLAVKNPPLGALAARTFARAEETFETGERLYLFSDGAYEIRDGDGRERGLEDFERELCARHDSNAADELDRLYKAVCSTAGAELLPDDFTMLRVEYA
jgi:serine phosphatase RsbU (regulator of sigma subunit)